MSTAEPIVAELYEEPAPAKLTAWTRIDAALEHAGEWLNPILVKECRQALKSKQFAITFCVLLLLGWLWSLLGVAILGTGISYSFTSGPFLFYWYYLFLAFALLVVVPFSAFRSLAVEREDNTFDLVAISTLPPHQIVAGKLGSAVLQMLVYFSALSPCLTFTYLLRGIDMPTIAYLMFYLFLASLAASMVGLFVATISREKHWQVVLSVIIIVGLFLGFIFGMLALSSMFQFQRLNFADSDFWIGNAAFFTAYASFFLLLYLAACAQLTFATDNRSSKLRYAMVLQQALFTGWMGVVMLKKDWGRDEEIYAIYLVLLGMYWGLMAMLMTGESGHLSVRVRRDLPQSFMGRALLSWFNPGPTTGYVFAVGNLCAAAVMALLGATWLEYYSGVSVRWRGGIGNPVEFTALMATVIISYVTIYVGVGNLLIGALRRLFPIGMLLTLVLQIALLLIGTITPNIIKGMLFGWNDDYLLLQLTDPISTLIETGRNRLGSGMAGAPYLLAFGAALIFLANLPQAARELRQTRLAKPVRVEEEDAVLAALVATPQEPADPWEAPAS